MTQPAFVLSYLCRAVAVETPQKVNARAPPPQLPVSVPSVRWGCGLVGARFGGTARKVGSTTAKRSSVRGGQEKATCALHSIPSRASKFIMSFDDTYHASHPVCPSRQVRVSSRQRTFSEGNLSPPPEQRPRRREDAIKRTLVCLVVAVLVAPRRFGPDLRPRTRVRRGGRLLASTSSPALGVIQREREKKRKKREPHRTRNPRRRRAASSM